MLIPGTEMHVVTFIFTAVECILLLFQLTFFLLRPSDQSRKRYLILLLSLIFYNIAGGLFPDPNIRIPVTVQNIIAYGCGFLMASYFPFYLYKALGLKKLRFHAIYGIFLFLLLPYFTFFVIAYSITQNLQWAKDYGLIIPFIYTISLVWAITKSVWIKYKETPAGSELSEILGVYAAVIPWASLPVVIYFDLGQATEATVTNVGFLVVTVLYIRKMIMEQREEYFQLQLLNKSLADKVKERTQQLEMANEQRTNTFVNLVHETKTPLTIINNIVEERFSQYSNREDLVIVKNNIGKLIQNVNNLFDLERFQKGFDYYNHDKITNFSQLVLDHLSFFSDWCGSRGITVEAQLQPNIFMKADPVALQGIINNLIQNAVKFTETGGTIKVILRTENSKVLFEVSDTGIGIAAGQQDKIFEPYYQIGRKSNNEGIGLGLPIVKKTILGLNGSINVESPVPGQSSGSRFTVCLHAYIPEANEHVEKHVLNPVYNFDTVKLPDTLPYNNSKQTVLLIEDNITMTDYLRKKLTGKYNVLWAVNGAEAFEKLRTYTVLPDLIISDVMMEQLDGLKFTEIIGKSSEYAHIPVLLISAKNSNNDKTRALRAGAVEFISKPFRSEELVLKVDAIIKKSVSLKRVLVDNALKGLGRPSDNLTEDLLSRIEKNFKSYNLTSREIEVAKAICEGRAYKEIAELLYISTLTVKKHAQNIYDKLSVNNKLQLIKKLQG
ncbi:ATP-binding protein [Chitinophaga sp. Ak27]|uniref:ATP-binding protein n=1 Tax=Chitinophaga sp. Ak27 TaxID=2726116 RepID=UPI00145CE384|nr:ATP-binding protein [Chitinophaga sp. Ak27]NLU91390.1 response regulator [Chitinophaga sp. Ak27]